jgi:hypothetical protein
MYTTERRGKLVERRVVVHLGAWPYVALPGHLVFGFMTNNYLTEESAAGHQRVYRLDRFIRFGPRKFTFRIGTYHV